MAQSPFSTSPSGAEDFFEFGVYRLEVSSRSLFRSGEFVPLPPKIFDTLLILVKEAGRVVTKDELMQHVWPDTFVEEGSIANHVSTLRKLLNPDFEGEGPIATVPKRGYRFTAELRLRSATGEIAVHAPAAPPVTSEIPREKGIPAIRSFRQTRAWLLAGGGILLLVFVLAIVAYIYSVSGRQVISEKDTIVITDFTNKTGDAVFDDALKQALIFDLEQSPRLNIISDHKVTSTLLLMGRSGEERVTGETARELCQRAGSKAMLVGTISALESEYLIGLQAINCVSGDTIMAEQSRATGRGQVLAALDQAASRMREKLGESLASIQKFSTPVDEVTTSSLEALKSYSIGRKITNGAGDQAALPYLQRAVEIDPNFAVAYSGLATSYSNIGQGTRAFEAARKAYELRDRVSAHERFRITGSYYLNVTGQLDEAIRTYDLWARDYPREAPPLGNQGFGYNMLGQLDEALRKADAGYQLVPASSTAAGTLAQIQLALDHPEEVRKINSAALHYTPDSFAIRLLVFQEAFLRSDTAAMQEQLLWGENHPGDGDWLLNSKGDSEAYFGRLKSATSWFDRAVLSAKKSDNAEMAAAWQAKAAWIEAEFGNPDAARRYASSALTTAPGRDVRAYVALAWARSGDIAAATKLATELDREFPQNTLLQKYWLPATRAAIALQLKNPAEAIRILQPVEPMDLSLSFPLDFGAMYTTYLRGEAYLQLHEGKEAARQFQKILDHPGVIINFVLGSLAHLGLARAYALDGDKVKSRAAYDHFLELWKDGDAENRVLRQARYERLQL
jgi:DNA-binding winged helix-turn-helix (wHTH) protein/tetratricopeptide (TPR) repeat protein